MMIFDLLPVGEENAIPKIDLLNVTGLEDRLLRRKVQLERLAGLPILTNCDKGGYYRPADPAQSLRFVKSMRRRAAETAAVADAVERSVMRDTGQVWLEGW